MKILVLGAAGMAGHVISIYLQERGHDITGFATRSLNYCNYIIGNAEDIGALKSILLEGKYDAVINCIGLLNQFAESSPTSAIFLNSYLPHFVVETLRNSKTKFIQMSTDCVFAGNTGPYFENSFPDGKTFYDRTKALGEINNSKDLTFRNSIIGPDIKTNGIGLFNWFMKQSGVLKGYTGAIWTGVTTLTLAKAMEKAIEDNITGLYNLVNNDSINKYDLLMLFNKYFRDNKLTIIPSNKLQLDKTLKCTRKDFDFIVPSYEQMIIEMKEWVYEHKELYPDYYTLWEN